MAEESGARSIEPSSTPVARVTVDLGLPHLDRLFDYAIPEALDADAQAGVRVRVRFAGQLVGGFVVERVATSQHQGRLARLEKVVSSESVLSPEIATLARAVADRYAGTLADVVRLAVPPRHARVEREQPKDRAIPVVAAPDPGPWQEYRHGAAFLSALERGEAPRLVWPVLPGRPPGGSDDWAAAIALAVATATSAGRGSLVVVPDSRDADRLTSAVADVVGADAVVTLAADLGPAERYRRWLAVRRGQVRVVVGPRAAMFAPVDDLGLAVLWDDGDDLLAEPRAPYPHAREVLALRSHLEGAALLLAGHAVTAESAQLVQSGWARLGDAARDLVRRAAPRIRMTGEDRDLSDDPAARTARIPTAAWQVARSALEQGPVLVQVPRRGYVPALACTQCRSQARCQRCAGPLGLDDPATGRLSCRWCGTPVPTFRCSECGAREVRATSIGAHRTAEELGRAFPSVPVRTSGRDGVLAEVDSRPALVVATPGAEPRAVGEYAAALLLDGDRLLGRPELRTSEEALRRWLNAAALVRPHGDGGQVVVVARSDAPAVQALVRWDPVGAARRELVARGQVRFPPAARVAELTGSAAGVSEMLELLDLPEAAEVLGPVGEESGVRTLIRVPRASGLRLARAVRAAAGTRSARKSPDPVRVRIDPVDLT